MQTSRSRIAWGCVVVLIAGAAWGQEQKPAVPAQGVAPPPVQQPSQAAEQAQPAAKVKVGQPAPDFTLLDVEGKKHSLAELKDRVVVLQWTNKDCPVVQRVLPDLRDLAKKHADKVVWLAIDSTPGRTAEQYANYAKEHQLSFPILLDADQKVGREYGATNTPHLFVINKGTVVYAGGLSDDPNGKKKPDEVRNYVDEAVTAVLVGKPVPLTETAAWGCKIKYKTNKGA